MKRTLFLMVSFSVIPLGACGVNQKIHDEVVSNLKKCQADQDACTKDRDAGTKQIGELRGLIDKEKLALHDQKKQSEQEQEEARKRLAQRERELEDLRRQNAQAQRRLDAFRKLTERFRKMIDAGKIQVVIRKGQMTMKLPAGILFASGKADLSKEGEQAITEVGFVLKEFPDRKFLITGHTDSVPLPRGGRFKDNWELSAARAVTVTKFLAAQGVAGGAIAAAGYGEFNPVGDNKTDEGKQENRRIEIVLLPNLEELPKMSDMN